MFDHQASCLPLMNRGTRWSGFSGHCQLAFFAKTSRLCEIANVPYFAGFPSTGRVWGSSRGFEPFVPI